MTATASFASGIDQPSRVLISKIAVIHCLRRTRSMIAARSSWLMLASLAFIWQALHASLSISDAFPVWRE
jgi:hypothetical protein